MIRRQFLGSLAAVAPAALLSRPTSPLPADQVAELDRLARAWVEADRRFYDCHRRARAMLAERFARCPSYEEEAEAQEACGCDAAGDELSRYYGPLLDLMGECGLKALLVGDALVYSSMDFDDDGTRLGDRGDLTLVEAPQLRALDAPRAGAAGGRL